MAKGEVYGRGEAEGFRRHIQMLALLALGFMFPQPVLAQTNSLATYAGQWRCQYSMQPYSGNAIDTHYWEFALALYENGQYQNQGFYYNPSIGQVQVQGQGSWQIISDAGNTAISINGQLMRQDAGWQPFTMLAKPTSNRNMYYQFRGNTHMMNIACQR